MRLRTGSWRYERGQSLVEFCVVVPAFIFLVLATFQFILIYRAKTTLDYATLEAARSGAIHNPGARKDLRGDIRGGLARGLTPLFATKADLASYGMARLRAEREVRLHADVEIVSPTRQAWQAYRERGYDGRYALPNDNLAFRDRSVRAAGVNVQDANLLKIRVVYHYPLIVPFVDRVISGTSALLRGDWRDDVRLRNDPLGNYRRLPIESSAVVRLQWPIDDPSALPNN